MTTRILSLWLALVWSSIAWAAPAGFVATVSGDAQVVRGSDQLPATLGMPIEQGDRLKTGAKSRLKVLLSDDSVLALGSKTELVVSSHLFRSGEGQRSTRIDLVSGKLRSLVQKMVGTDKANFEVRTSNAVAGVRGTEFVMSSEGGEARLYTLSGEVEFGGKDGARVLVAAGEGSRTEEGGAAKPPEMVASAELDGLKAETDAQQQPAQVAWNLPLQSLSARPGPAPGGDEGGGDSRQQQQTGNAVETGGDSDGPDDRYTSLNQNPPVVPGGGAFMGGLPDEGGVGESPIWGGPPLDPANDKQGFALHIHLHRGR